MPWRPPSGRGAKEVDAQHGVEPDRVAVHVFGGRNRAAEARAPLPRTNSSSNSRNEMSLAACPASTTITRRPRKPAVFPASARCGIDRVGAARERDGLVDLRGKFVWLARVASASMATVADIAESMPTLCRATGDGRYCGAGPRRRRRRRGVPGRVEAVGSESGLPCGARAQRSRTAPWVRTPGMAGVDACSGTARHRPKRRRLMQHRHRRRPLRDRHVMAGRAIVKRDPHCSAGAAAGSAAMGRGLVVRRGPGGHASRSGRSGTARA